MGTGGVRLGMARAYSVDLRERAVHALLTGMSLAEAASIFAVSESTLSRWKHLVVTGQSLIPKPRPGRPRLVPPADEEALRQQVAAAPDATLDMHRAMWAQTHGVLLSNPTMSRELARLDLPLKRSR